MDDLISRSALIEELHQKKSIMVAEPDGKHSVNLETVIDYIGEYPTVDAVPVVHGEWIENETMIRSLFIENYHCSICNTISHKRNFCSNCGADMRKKV